MALTENNELLYQLLDPPARRVYDVSVLAGDIAELREARDSYLADIAMLREGGHDVAPDAELLARIDTEIAASIEALDGLDEQEA